LGRALDLLVAELLGGVGVGVGGGVGHAYFRDSANVSLPPYAHPSPMRPARSTFVTRSLGRRRRTFTRASRAGDARETPVAYGLGHGGPRARPLPHDPRPQTGLPDRRRGPAPAAAARHR